MVLTITTNPNLAETPENVYLEKYVFCRRVQ